jgi:hypothetical protein
MPTARRGLPRSSTFAAAMGLAAGLFIAAVGVPLLSDRQSVRDGLVADGGPADAGQGQDGGVPGDLLPSGAASAAGGAPGSGPAGAGQPGSASGTGTSSGAGAPGGAPGGSGGSAGGSGGGSAGTSGSGDSRERGVSPTVLRVGVMLADLGGASSAGISVPGFSPQEQRREYEAYFAHINKTGIAGRKIEPVYRTVDALSTDSMNAACIYYAQEVAVFAVMNIVGYYGDPVLCMTVQHGIPFLTADSSVDSFYQRAGGNLVTTTMSKTRILRNQALRMHSQGLLKDRTIGVIDDEVTPEAVDRGLFPELKRLGYKVTHHTRLSADTSTGQSQIPVEISAMRRAGVDTVFVAAGLIYMTSWTQQADRQGYVPKYLLSDYAAGATDSYTGRFPDSFDGAIGVTGTRVGELTAGRPETKVDAACLANRGGIKRTDASAGFSLAVCGQLQIFQSAAERSGRELTRARWRSAVAATGAFDLPAYGGGLLAANRFDASSKLRTLKWAKDCKCWMPLDEFTRAQY